MAEAPPLQRAVAYNRVPSFRFATPPRSRPGPSSDSSASPSLAAGLEWLAADLHPERSLKEAGLVWAASRAGPQATRGAAEDPFLPGWCLDGRPLATGPGRADLSAAGLAGPVMQGSEGSAADSSGTEQDPPVGWTPDGASASSPVPDEVSEDLALAYNEDMESLSRPPPGITGFCWTGVMDAAHAAWIGGTRLLRYGELMPGGVSRALEVLVPGSSGAAPDTAGDAAGSADSASTVVGGRAHKQLVLELGMGRGRVALQLFLEGATVIAVELANERYSLGVAAIERLAHRSPERFEISRRSAQAVRIRHRRGHRGGICEFRLGNFFEAVSGQEVEAANLIFLQVCVPPPAWPRLQALLGHAQAGCRVLMYESIGKVWEGDASPPFTSLGNPFLACSWSPDRGHQFHCYERLQADEPVFVPVNAESEEDMRL